MINLPPILAWLIPLTIWEVIWKGISLWKCAKKNHLVWFIAILVLNTVGILPIIYLLFFHKRKKKKKGKHKKRK